MGPKRKLQEYMPTLRDETIFVSCVLRFYEQNDTVDYFNQPDQDRLKKLGVMYREAGGGGPTINVYRKYRKLCERVQNEHGKLDRAGLKRWLETRNYRHGESGGTVSVQNTSNIYGNTMATKIFTKTDPSGSIFRYKFFLFNCDCSDATQNLSEYIKTCILENGGILLLEEDDLFEPGNSDALVINCGPLNATYAVFLNKHRNKIYAPSLVFAALGAQALKVSDDFIFNLHNTGSTLNIGCQTETNSIKMKQGESQTEANDDLGHLKGAVFLEETAVPQAEFSTSHIGIEVKTYCFSSNTLMARCVAVSADETKIFRLFSLASILTKYQEATSVGLQLDLKDCINLYIGKTIKVQGPTGEVEVEGDKQPKPDGMKTFSECKRSIERVFSSASVKAGEKKQRNKNPDDTHNEEKKMSFDLIEKNQIYFSSLFPEISAATMNVFKEFLFYNQN